jgi:uncharacterized protein YkwD
MFVRLTRTTRLLTGSLACLAALALVAVEAPRAEAQTTAALINQQRAAHGLAPVAYNPQLVGASIRHSRDMRNNAFSSHTGSDGSTPGQRIAQAGYPAAKTGEIIGYSFGSPGFVWADRDMVNWWMNSPGHRAHILDPAFTEFGSTMASRTTNGVMHKYWTVVFGRR